WSADHSLNVGAVSSFAYPFGARNDAVKRVVREAGLECAFNTDPGVIYKDDFDPYDLNRYSVHSTDSVTTLKPYIDEAIANNGWFVILCHHIDNTAADNFTISPATFQAIVNYVKSKNAHVMTLEQTFNLLTSD